MGEPLPALAVGLLGLGSCACGFIAGATRLKRDDIILSTVMAWYAALRAGLLFFLATAANHPGGRGNAPECYDYVRVGILFEPAAYQAFLVTFFGFLSGGALHKGAEAPAS